MKLGSYYFGSNKKYQSLVLISELLIFSMALWFSERGMAAARFQPVEHLVQNTWDVPAGACHIEPITLSAGSRLYGSYSVQGAVDNRVSIQLLDDWNFGLWRVGQPYVQFRDMSTTVNGLANLKFVSPKSGQYYALFCNDKAFMLNRLISADLYRASNELGPKDQIFRDELDKILAGVHEIFNLPEFDLSVEPCGLVNAFSDPNITVCTEIIDSFPRNKLSDLFTFVFLHELGHTTLKLWGLPGADNEDTADEFAAAFLLMMNKEAVVDSAAQWWLSQSGHVRAEALGKIGVDDRHSLTIQRARNLHRWASDNGELIQRWATLWAPHFTDAALRGIAKNPRFVNNAAIQHELALHDNSNSTTTMAEAHESELTKSAGETPLTKRLLDLKQAHDAGLITDEEYKAQRLKALEN